MTSFTAVKAKTGPQAVDLCEWRIPQTLVSGPESEKMYKPGTSSSSSISSVFALISPVAATERVVIQIWICKLIHVCIGHGTNDHTSYCTQLIALLSTWKRTFLFLATDYCKVSPKYNGLNSSLQCMCLHDWCLGVFHVLLKKLCCAQNRAFTDFTGTTHGYCQLSFTGSKSPSIPYKWFVHFTKAICYSELNKLRYQEMTDDL